MNRFRSTLIALIGLLLFATACKKDTDITNSVPVTNAGPSQNITLPTPLNLSGSGTDADGHIVAYLWSQVAGPNTPVIANPGAMNTAVSGIIAGNYILQLMVTDDGGATGVDTVSIKVNPAPEITLTLQPANNPTDFAVAELNGIDQTGHSGLDIPIETWTNGGNPVIIRSLLKFDLSTIPQNSTIVSANLYLYSYPPPTPNGNFTDPNFGTSNGMTLQRVTTDWSPSTITWFNQPSVTSQNQVTIPQTASSILDLNLDVASLVSTMVTTNSNYGFLIKLQNEVTYNSRIFVSSYNTTYPTKHPKLVIVYR